MSLKKTGAYLSLLIPQSWLSTSFIVKRAQLLADNPDSCEHEWDVVAGILDAVELQVQCRKYATYSEVPNPTKEEWEACHDAMENPYHWTDISRIRYYQAGDAIL